MDKKHPDDLKEEISKISPFLGNIDKENPFKVPNDYFKSLETDIMHKVKEEVVFGNKPDHPILQRIKEWLQLLTMPRLALVMSSVIVLVIAGTLIFKNNQSETLVISPVGQEVYQYIEAHIGDFEAEDIIEVMDAEDVEGLSMFNDPDIDIEEYIESEDIDIEEIL